MPFKLLSNKGRELPWPVADKFYALSAQSGNDHRAINTSGCTKRSRCKVIHGGMKEAAKRS
jgi:hypothetical protein